MGHCNVRTVKEVNFYGPSNEYVISGSDDGNIFIWHKDEAKIVNILKGDKHVVNCIQVSKYGTFHVRQNLSKY
jgi:WD40 repeat protein